MGRPLIPVAVQGRGIRTLNFVEPDAIVSRPIGCPPPLALVRFRPPELGNNSKLTIAVSRPSSGAVQTLSELLSFLDKGKGRIHTCGMLST